MIGSSTSPGPAAKYAAVPGSMKQVKRWVVWQYEIRDGKKTKVLHTPGRGQAKSTDPDTWVSFEEAVRSEPFYSGIGFVLGDGWLGLDADHVRDTETGEWAPGILDEIKSVQSYAEVSPSGSGAHVIAFGTKPGDRSRAAGEVWEMYDRGRFFTVTGDHIPGTPDEVQEPAPGSLEAIYAKFGTSKTAKERQIRKPESVVAKLPQQISAGELTDAEIIEKCQNAANAAKFNALWRGDIAGYASHSEADLALCNVLAFYTRDPAQLERLIRQSGLYREKWDRTDYVTRTISTAVQACRETWSPGLSSLSPEERYLRRVEYRRRMRAARLEVRG
jgi:putative DNA primase/helicase